MRYFVLFVLCWIFIIVEIIPASAQYLGDIEKMVIWPPECIGIKCPPLFESSLNALTEPISKSDIVLVGEIIQANPNAKQNQTEYAIKVDKYIKTTKTFDLITAIGDGVYKKDSIFLTEIEYYNSPIFKKDDKVFVYLSEKNGKYKILPYSFAISKNIPTGPPPEIMLASSDKLKYRYGDSITVSGSVKKAYIFDSSIRSQDSSVYLLVKNPDNLVYENRTLDVSPDGTFAYQFKIKGKFAIDGQYSIDVNSGSMTWSWPVSYESGHIRPPLQQYKSGIPIDKIQCKDRFVVAIKASNDVPACVKKETLQKLKALGWAKQPKVVLQSTFNEMNYSQFLDFCNKYDPALSDLMSTEERMVSNLCDFRDRGFDEKQWNWLNGTKLNWKNFAQKKAEEYARNLTLYKEHGIEDSLSVKSIVSLRESFPPTMSTTISFDYVLDSETKQYKKEFMVGISGLSERTDNISSQMTEFHKEMIRKT